MNDFKNLGILEGIENGLFSDMSPGSVDGTVSGFLSASTKDYRLQITDFRSQVVNYEACYNHLSETVIGHFYYRHVAELLKKVNENGCNMCFHFFRR